jgi:hypothetical protein
VRVLKRLSELTLEYDLEDQRGKAFKARKVFQSGRVLDAEPCIFKTGQQTKVNLTTGNWSFSSSVEFWSHCALLGFHSNCGRGHGVGAADYFFVLHTHTRTLKVLMFSL